MKRIVMTLALLAVLIAAPAFAGERILIEAKGLVCDFCVQSLTKVFMKQEEVSAIDVNLDTKIITVDLKDGKTMEDEKIRKLVTDSGYDVGNITRPATPAQEKP